MTKGIKSAVSRMRDFATPGGAIYAELTLYYNPRLDEVRCFDAFDVRTTAEYITETVSDDLARKYSLVRHYDIRDFLADAIPLFRCSQVMKMAELRQRLADINVASIRDAYLIGVPLDDISV